MEGISRLWLRRARGLRMKRSLMEAGMSRLRREGEWDYLVEDLVVEGGPVCLVDLGLVDNWRADVYLGELDCE